jgi:hypothetical protein
MTATPNDFMLERAVALLVEGQQWNAAIGLMALIAQHYPKKGSAWFGLGSLLWRLRQPHLIDEAITALKRSLDVDDERNTRVMLRTVEEEARKNGTNPDDLKSFGGSPYPFFADLVDFTPQTLIDAVGALEWDQRAQMLTFLGDQPGDLFDALVEAMANNDPNANVKRSAAQALKARPAKPAPPPPASVDVPVDPDETGEMPPSDA